MLDQLPCRFDPLETEMVEQRFTQIQANRHIGFAWQKLQHTLDGRIQVNLAEQIAGPEPEIPGATRELVAHGGNRVAAPNALLSAYRPALEVITGVAAVGVAIAASGLAFPGVRRAGTGSRRPAEEIERPEFETVAR